MPKNVPKNRTVPIFIEALRVVDFLGLESVSWRKKDGREYPASVGIKFASCDEVHGFLVTA